MANIPFPPAVELNKQLAIEATPLGARMRRSDGDHDGLPGQPRVAIDKPGMLAEYLVREHSTTELDVLAPKLWLVSTPRYCHISPLHHQAVRGRRIIVTENPLLHLVWYYDRIFIKPIPRYMLSHCFWEFLATQPVELRGAIAGFIRTYSYLIKYPCDFRLATSDEDQLHLLPRDDGSSVTDGLDQITFERFSEFIAPFHGLSDNSVSSRYHYGELRLSRLNMCARIFLRKLTFFHTDAQWGSYLGRFLAPLLSIFVVLSVALSAMQVELGVQGPLQDSAPRWRGVANVSRWFSTLVLVVIAVVVVFFFLLIAFMMIHDIWFAKSVLRYKRQAPVDGSTIFKSGVV